MLCVLPKNKNSILYILFLWSFLLKCRKSRRKRWTSEEPLWIMLRDLWVVVWIHKQYIREKRVKCWSLRTIINQNKASGKSKRQQTNWKKRKETVKMFISPGCWWITKFPIFDLLNLHNIPVALVGFGKIIKKLT